MFSLSYYFKAINIKRTGLFCLVFFSPAYGYEINGIVRSANGLSEYIAGAEIYEEYGNDTPVAITDNNGKFKYNTKSDAPVRLKARKRGFVDGLGYPDGNGMPIIRKEDTNSIVVFKLNRFFKQKNFEIYAIYGDKDCILNGSINIGPICPDKTNEYEIDFLKEPSSGCDSAFATPNDKGGLVVPYLTNTIDFFYAQYRGGVSFSQEVEENVYYYSVTEDNVQFEYLSDKFKYKYDMGKSLGWYKQYKDADEFISENIKEFFKFCPRKLKEYEDYRKENKSAKHSDTKELEKSYKEAKADEQSLANRSLTALTTAATGIGGMQLAQGLAEQKADKEAERNMEAYMATFRCEYGNSESVKGGMTAIALPGGNDLEMMGLRNEYFTLATSLKERKWSFGLKPGIESEIILDKSQLGLYDDENNDITGGIYASLYRAKMDNESDLEKLQEMKDASKKRVVGGAIAAGIGVTVGVVGNTLINEKQGQQLKQETETTNYIIKSDPNPTKCSLSECLNKLTISNRTKTSEWYKKVSEFCAQQFPQEKDCDKIMLVYSDDVSTIKSVDFLIANNYDYDFYKKSIIEYCDWYVCLDKNDPSLDTELFSDRKYEFASISNDIKKFTNWARTCFKTAGALDYFDLQGSDIISSILQIDYDKIDCSRLDENKTETDIIVKGNKISEYLQFTSGDNVLSNMQKLLGIYAKYIIKRNSQQ